MNPIGNILKEKLGQKGFVKNVSKKQIKKITNKMNKILAIYGTLRKNQKAEHQMDSCKFIGEGIVNDMELVTTGIWLPASRRGNGNIKVEVYEVTDEQLEYFDIYEGVKRNFYNREEVDININGETIKGYMYVGDKIFEMYTGWKMREDGDYSAHMLEVKRE